MACPHSPPAGGCTQVQQCPSLLQELEFPIELEQLEGGARAEAWGGAGGGYWGDRTRSPPVLSARRDPHPSPWPGGRTCPAGSCPVCFSCPWWWRGGPSGGLGCAVSQGLGLGGERGVRGGLRLCRGAPASLSVLSVSPPVPPVSLQLSFSAPLVTPLSAPPVPSLTALPVPPHSPRHCSQHCPLRPTRIPQFSPEASNHQCSTSPQP